MDLVDCELKGISLSIQKLVNFLSAVSSTLLLTAWVHILGQSKFTLKYISRTFLFSCLRLCTIKLIWKRLTKPVLWFSRIKMASLFFLLLLFSPAAFLIYSPHRMVSRSCLGFIYWYKLLGLTITYWRGIKQLF